MSHDILNDCNCLEMLHLVRKMLLHTLHPKGLILGGTSMPK